MTGGRGRGEGEYKGLVVFDILQLAAGRFILKGEKEVKKNGNRGTVL
jgi:hypothetical protein